MTITAKGIVTTSIVIAVAASFLAAGLYLFSGVDRVTPDEDDWFVLVHGQVANELELHISDLEGMGRKDIPMALRGTGEDGEVHAYTGVPLMDLVLEAGPDPNATKVRIRAADAYSASFDMDEVGRGGMYLVWEKDGSALLPRSRGGEGPVRFIVDQATVGTYNAQYCVKYVSEVIVE